MNIPDACRDWRDAMARGNDERHVLDNIELDQCVPDGVADEFFRRLAETSPWSDATDAWRKAKSVVYDADGPDRFYCTGGPVPSDRMAKLLRFRPATEWDRLIQDIDPDRARDLTRAYGIRPDNPNWPEELNEAQRNALCADIQRGYPTGHLSGITWVADDEAVHVTSSNLREVLQRLGLPHFEGHAWALVLRYNRTDVNEDLHVPRALDAVDSWPFDVQLDCDAAVGMTKPTAEAPPEASGYPEAVHRSKRIDLPNMELAPIDGDSH